MQLHLSLLGTFQVSWAQTPLEFATGSVRALLAYLAVEAHPAGALHGARHPRETLAALLWPDRSQAIAYSNLRQTLARLRKALQDVHTSPPPLLITPKTVQFHHPAAVIDVLRFEGLRSICTAHDHPDLADCPACCDRLRQAVDLYRGEFLQGFYLEGSQPFEEWLLFKREQLHRQALEMLHTLTVHAERRADYTQMAHFATRQLALEPWREQAHRQLMWALAAGGQHSAALAQYGACCRILTEQLDAPPAAETTALYERIRSGVSLQHTDRPPGPEDLERGAAAPAPTYPKLSEAPTVPVVFGRQHELAQLVAWLVHERCRLVALLGIGGVGKTTLAAAVVKAVASHFDRLIWQSLLNAPPLDEVLRGALQTLSGHTLTKLPSSLDEQLALLLGYLRQQRCLLVLDNLESILQADQPGHFRPGYEGYAQLLQWVAERGHQSCLLLTSRERPQGLARREEDTPLVRMLPLEGLDVVAGQAMLAARGLLAPVVDATALVQRYSGNPLALKLVAQTVQEVFGGDIAAFLGVEAPIFDDIHTVLDQQFARLSSLEREILLWLAVEREPISAPDLRANLIDPGSPRAFVESLRALQRRSLIGQTPQGFVLQNVVTEYLTEYLVDQVCWEVEAEFGIRSSEYGMQSVDDSAFHIRHSALNRYALLKAQAKEYVRQSQVRLLLAPIATRLVTGLGQAKLAVQLHRHIDTLRAATLGRPQDAPGYAAANILHLLLQLGFDVAGYDFSHLNVRQAYLRRVALPGVNFAGADLTGAVFTDTFRSMTCVAFSPDTHYLAAGSGEGTIRLWQVADRQPCGVCTGHTSFIWSITFSPDGLWLASASEDSTVRLWDAHTGQLLYTLTGHTRWLKSVVFSPDGALLASSGGDQTVRLWDARTGEPVKILHGHSGGVWSVAFSPDGRRLASASEDSTVRLWELQTGSPLQTLHGHHGRVTAVAFSPDGALLASSAHDGTVRIWDAHSGQALHVFSISGDWITSVVFSPDGSLLASACYDHTVRVWEVGNPPGAGQPRHMLSGHTDGVDAAVFSADGLLLASVSWDQTVRLWDARSGQAIDILHGYSRALESVTFCLRGAAVASCGLDRIVRLWDARSGQLLHTLQGHANRVLALAASPDGALLASGSADQTVRLWDAHKGQAIRGFRGHTDIVTSVAFSPDGALLASGSADQTVCLWDVHTGQVIRTLRMHRDAVMAVAFSPDGALLASGGREQIVYISDVRTGKVLATLHGHTKWIKAVAFRPRPEGSSVLLASSGDEGIIHLWDVSTAFALSKAKGPNPGVQRDGVVRTFHGHTNVIESVAFSPDGSLLVSASYDGTVRLWQVDTGEPLHTLRGHTNWVRSVAFSSDGMVVVSGSDDETSRLWDVQTGACLTTLRAEGPYAGMNITGVTGISETQRAALKVLGAVET